MRLSLANCAELAEKSYLASDQIKQGMKPVGVVASLDNKGAQALMLDHKVLVIPGSNDLIDWFRNFDVYKILGVSFDARQTTRHKTGALFHAGFYKHATLVAEFARKHDARFVIGHSLGAAAAQILGTSMGIPAVGFASPRVKLGAGRLMNEDKVLNICRSDDLVTRVPPSEAGFRRLGQSVRLIPPVTNPGMDHSMKHYITGLTFDCFDNNMPKNWG